MKTVKKIFYSTGVLLVVTVMIFACTAVIQLGMGILGESMHIAISDDMLYSISGNLGVTLAGICIAGYAEKKGKQGSDKNGQGHKFEIKKALLYGIFAICLCHVLFSAVTTILFAQILPIAAEQSESNNIYLDILCGVILAPIGEELLFRSGLYSLLKQKLKSVSAMVLCAGIFAVFHGYNVLGFASCFFAGIIFTLVYEKTGNVRYSILTHALCNLFTLIFNTMEQKGVTLFGNPIQYEVNGYNMYHGIVIVAAVLFLIKLYIDSRGKKNVSNISCG
jgi:membrane protease YdiL (CAAX protease family)